MADKKDNGLQVMAIVIIAIIIVFLMPIIYVTFSTDIQLVEEDISLVENQIEKATQKNNEPFENAYSSFDYNTSAGNNGFESRILKKR